MRMILRLTHSVTWVRHTTSLVLPWLSSPLGKPGEGPLQLIFRRQQKKFILQFPTTFSSSVHILLHLPRLSLQGSQAANSPRSTKSSWYISPGTPWKWEKVKSRQKKKKKKERVCMTLKSVFLKTQSQFFKELCFLQDGVGEELMLKQEVGTFPALHALHASKVSKCSRTKCDVYCRTIKIHAWSFCKGYRMKVGRPPRDLKGSLKAEVKLGSVLVWAW